MYTVNDESRYLLIHGVPAISVTSELKTMFQKYGSLDDMNIVTDYPADKFCEVYYAKFHSNQSARLAKIHLDDKCFYGGVLHVCYAPELETIEDTRNKLKIRNQKINQLLKTPTKSKPSLKTFLNDNLPSTCEKESVTPPRAVLLTSNPSDDSSDVRSTSSHISKPVKRVIYHRANQNGKQPRIV